MKIWPSSLEFHIYTNLGNKPQIQATQMAPKIIIQIAMAIIIPKSNPSDPWESSLISCSISRSSSSSDGSVCSTLNFERFGFVFF